MTEVVAYFTKEEILEQVNKMDNETLLDVYADEQRRKQRILSTSEGLFSKDYFYQKDLLDILKEELLKRMK